MITELETSNCILFLGSGFSADGRNILNKKPPVGDGLRLDLVELMNDATYGEYDLQTVSEAAANDTSIDLYQELYNRYTMTEIPDDQEHILSLPWRRIYTTNYDDAVELVSPRRSTFNYDDPKPRRIPDGSVIHLHGVIRSTTPDSVMDQLVLGERSYVRQHNEKSPWYDEFDRDVRFADATFFVGYSLKDQHITALLLKNPDTKGKVFFVTRGEPDKPTTSKLSQYGNIMPIGISGFSDFARNTPKPPPVVSDPNQLRSLRYLNPLQDKAALTPPTSSEVRSFLTFGSFNFKRMIAGLKVNSYVVGRGEAVAKAVVALQSSRTLMVDARIGNGKTTFLHLLAGALSERNVKCFMCRSNAMTASHDLEALRAMGKVAIFFDSYGSALDLIQEFASLPEAVFVVAVRSSVLAVQMHEILAKFPSPIATASLNRLTRDDRIAFSQLASDAGLLSSDFEQKASAAKDFRELVLTLFDNRIVRTAIEKELLPKLGDNKVRAIFIASYLLKESGHDADPVFLRDVTGIDPYDVLYSVEHVASEVFDLRDQLQLRSAVFSEYLVRNFFDPKELLVTVEHLITLSTLRRDERRFQRMSGALMQFSFLSRVFSKMPESKTELHGLFERLRHNNAINAEPLFWLQYAISMVDTDPEISENFIATAYARAKDRKGFLTYQIDTFALRLAVQVETTRKGNVVERFDYIIEKLGTVINMIGDSSHRFYAINVLGDFEPFTAARARMLTITQKNRLVYDLSRAVSALESLSMDYRAQSGSDATKESLIRSKDHLLA